MKPWTKVCTLILIFKIFDLNVLDCDKTIFIWKLYLHKPLWKQNDIKYIVLSQPWWTVQSFFSGWNHFYYSSHYLQMHFYKAFLFPVLRHFWLNLAELEIKLMLNVHVNQHKLNYNQLSGPKMIKVTQLFQNQEAKREIIKIHTAINFNPQTCIGNKITWWS